jgi:hypothetical protein
VIAGLLLTLGGALAGSVPLLLKQRGASATVYLGSHVGGPGVG